MTNLTKPQLIFLGGVGLLVLFLVLLFTGIIPGLRGASSNPQEIRATLTFWGVGDAVEAYSAAFANFKTIYPNVQLNYRSFSSYEAYERTLLDALASGQGPDILMLENTALPKHINKISPSPATIFSLQQVRQLFPQVVEQDFASQGAVYALPLSIDTLALIYNRDLLDEAAVPVPATWEAFAASVANLTARDADGTISRAGAAIGNAANIDRAADLLSLLMLQTGAKMTNEERTAASFASSEGRNALSFYASFANPQSSAYTWNATFPNSLDAFGGEKVAVIFNYAASARELKNRYPFLHIGIAPIPQPQTAQKSVAYPNYLGYAVSRQSAYKTIAWNFIVALTTNEGSARGYVSNTEKPPALRSLIAAELNNINLGVFARQALIARSWYQADGAAAAKILAEMIESVVAGRTNAANALEQAQSRMTQLISSYRQAE